MQPPSVRRQPAAVTLELGADPRIRDSKHDGNARAWAEFFRRREILELLAAHEAR